jgi:RimJ/RimL family protein N-acetyltransferase
MTISSFDFTQNYVLENEVALLRPIESTDLEHLLDFSVNEPDLWKYSLVQAGGGEANLRKYMEIALQARKTEKEYAFIVFDKQKNSYAGSTRFYDIQLNFNTLQLGYTWYGKQFQGTKLNKNCKFLLLSFAFEQMGMERVEFRADAKNERSVAAMKSIGCVVDGILRSNMPNLEGGRRDSIVLSILKSEWENGVKEQLKSKL